MISQTYNLQDYETAAEEDSNYQHGQKILLDETIVFAANQKATILEIGGGSGVFTEQLARRLSGVSIDVIEPDVEWFNVLKTRMSDFPNIRCEQSEIESFKGIFYDICCASFALHHIPYENLSVSIERICGMLRDCGYFLVLDKHIPDFANEFERRATLKTYHGYFLTYKKQRNLSKAAEFEIASLESNLLKMGDYKISVNTLEKKCSNNFRLFKRIKIAPLGSGHGLQAEVVENLRAAGVALNKDEEKQIQNTLRLSNWGIFVHIFQKVSR